MQLPGFNEFRDNFYPSGAAVKIVPDNIYELLTPSSPRTLPGEVPSGKRVSFFIIKKLLYNELLNLFYFISYLLNSKTVAKQSPLEGGHLIKR